MSLIDDALKRAQEATGQRGTKPEARPWTPAPLPDAGLARRRRMVRFLAWSLSAAAALVGVGLLVYAVRDASAPPRDRPAAAPLATPPPPAPTLAETIVTTPVAPVAVAPARARPTRLATPDGPPSSAESTPAEIPAAPPAPRPIVDGRRYVGAVDLPGGGRIELGGIVWSESEPRALLNDRIVGTAGYVEGFTVSKIEEDRVVLEKDGVTISISLK